MREKTIYEKIAEKYNTTPEEVRREMQIAIDAGFDNPDSAVQEEWKKMILSILVYTLFSRMFDLMQRPVVNHSIVGA